MLFSKVNLKHTCAPSQSAKTEKKKVNRQHDGEIHAQVIFSALFHKCSFILHINPTKSLSR